MQPEKTSTPPLPAVCQPVSTAPVIHGSVTPDGSFFFWGEKPSGPAAKRRGRRAATPKLSPHPFALPAASLKKILTGLPGQVPVIEDTLVLWLPTTGQAPEPSPEVRVRAGFLRERTRPYFTQGLSRSSTLLSHHSLISIHGYSGTCIPYPR